MGERPIIWLALALLCGLILGEFFSYFPVTLILLVLSLLLLESHFYRGRLLSFPLISVGVLGFLLIQISARPLSSKDLRTYVDQGPIRIIAEVSKPPRHTPRHVSLQMEGIEILSNNRIYPVEGRFQLNIWRKEVPIIYGDQLELHIRLRRPKQFQNQGSFQYANYRERVGWSGVANLSNLTGLKKIGEGGNPFLKILFQWREEVRKRILSSFAHPTAALLMAFVIGETGYLTDEVRETFSASGAAHLLAVSGSHLAFVSLLVFALTRWTILRLPEPMLLRISIWKIPSQWAALLTAGAAIFYTLLAGAKIGTLRALTMILVYLFSIWIGRKRNAKISLALAALLIVAFQPRAIFEISFQLSFLAVLSIVLIMEMQKEERQTDFLKEERSFIQRLFSNRLRPLLLSTIGASLGTLPLTLFYFHQFSWISLFANLILLPLAGWIMVPFGLLSVVFSLFLTEGIPLVIWHDRLWSLFYDLVAFFAQFPVADFHFASPSLWFIFLYYSCFLFLIVWKKPIKWFLVPLISFLLTFFVWGGLRIPPENLRVTFLDVGQGDATLIEFPNGKTMLVDGGNRQAGKFGVAPYLWQRRIRKIDFLVGTHPQNDHMGGFSYLIRRFEVGEIWTNGQENDTPHYRSFLTAIEMKGIRQRIITNREPEMKIDSCRLLFLHPAEENFYKEQDMNNHSIVMQLICPTFGTESISFLLTGDIEQEAEASLVETLSGLQSAVLKIPHHGSRTSSGSVFISAVSPKIATLSVGRKNRYRHPHPEIVASYEAIGTDLYRTDEQGAVTIEIIREQNESNLKVGSYQDGKIEAIHWSEEPLRQEWENVKKSFL